MKKWKLVLLVVCGALPALAFLLFALIDPAHAEFYGIKEATENIAIPVKMPLDTLGRQDFTPDSIQIFTYVDNDTWAAYTASGAGFALTGIDTSSERGGTQLWFVDQIQDIDGDGGNGQLAIQILTWTMGYPTETFGTVQVIYDSLNTRLLPGDTADWDIDDIAAAIDIDSLLLAVTDANKANFKATGFATAADGDSVIQAIADANKANFKATGFSTLTTSDNIGINWADIDNPTTAVDLSATILRSVDSALQIGADGIDAASIKDDAIDSGAYTDDAKKMIAIRADSGAVEVDSVALRPMIADVIHDSTLALGDIVDGFWGENDTTVIDNSQIGEWMVNNLSAAGTVPDSTLNDIAMMGNYHVIDSTLAKELNDSLGSQGWTPPDSVIVDGSAFANLIGAINHLVLDAGTITNDELATSAVNKILAGIFTYDMSAAFTDGTFADMIQSDSIMIGDVIDKLQALGLKDSVIAGVLSEFAFTGNYVQSIPEAVGDTMAQDLFNADTASYTHADGTYGREMIDAGGMASVSDADMASIADTLLNRATYPNHTDTTTVGGKIHAMSDSLISQGWAATSSGIGTGVVSDTIFAVDTSGSDTYISGTYVRARNSSGQLLGEGMTNGSGYIVLQLPQSTSITISAFHPGYTWNDNTWTSTSGTEDTDSLMGYNVDIAAPGSASLKPVYDWIYPGDADTASCYGITVLAQLIVPGDSIIAPYDSATGVIISREPIKVTTNTSCKFQHNLYPNEGTTSAIIPHGTQWRFYTLDEYYDMTVTLTGTASEQVSAIHRSEVDR